MEVAERLRRQLLEQSRYIHYDTPISDATANAYLATPRHLFVSRYREWGSREWHDVGAQNLQEHLATLYANRPLILFGEDDDDIPSTISQPSFVLRMLDLLQLGPGHMVFELGAGSGWNAALMAHLVGRTGHVYSLEIIPEVAEAAGGVIRRLGIENMSVLAADGGEGYPTGAPYDRAIFTAGAYDLPRPFYDQIAPNGLQLAVIKNEGGGDNLFLLQRRTDHFASLESMPCGFVQLRGRYQIDTLGPGHLETLPEWPVLQQQEISRTRFWWGGKGREGAVWRTLGIRSFLGITEPCFRAFKTMKADARTREEHYFGIWLPGGALLGARTRRLAHYVWKFRREGAAAGPGAAVGRPRHADGGQLCPARVSERCAGNGWRKRMARNAKGVEVSMEPRSRGRFRTSGPWLTGGSSAALGHVVAT